MADKRKFRPQAKFQDSYLELVQAFPLVSIGSDEHLEAASDSVDQLMAKDSLDHGEEMYLDALSDLIATYEDRHHDIEPAPMKSRSQVDLRQTLANFLGEWLSQLLVTSVENDTKWSAQVHARMQNQLRTEDRSNLC